jgi:hypothetical protein
MPFNFFYYAKRLLNVYFYLLNILTCVHNVARAKPATFLGTYPCTLIIEMKVGFLLADSQFGIFM